MVEPQLSPEEVELTALSALRTAQEVRDARDLGISGLSFQVPEHEQAWDYLVARADAGRTVSQADVLRATGVELLADVTDTETFLDLLVNRSLERRAYRVLVQRAEELAADPQGTLRKLVAELGTVLAPTAGSHGRYFDSDADARFGEYLRRAETVEEQGHVGWLTGLPTFDQDGDTWKPGELVSIQGALNTGKSFLLLWLAKNVYEQGAKVLFLSPESTVQDVEARLDAMMARSLGLELSVRRLRNGREDQETLQDYFEQLARQERSDWVTRDAGDAGTFSTTDIVSLTRQVRPDVLAIDGFHLIRGENSSWESMKQAAETVKGLAQDLGMVVLTVSQAQRQAVVATDDAPGLGQAAYGMALNEASNRVISLATKVGDRKQRVFTVPKNRDGEQIHERRYLVFDVDRGHIEERTAGEDPQTGFVDF